MPEYRISKRAARDIEGLTAYGIEHFGRVQADAYLSGLRRTLELISTQPEAGKECSPQLQRARAIRRLPFESHVIYYRVTAARLLVIRVLHKGMDPTLHV